MKKAVPTLALPHGLVTQQPSTLANTNQSSNSRNLHGPQALRHTSLGLLQSGTNLGITFNQTSSPSKSKLGSYKDILMPNLSNKYSIHRSYKPINDRERDRMTELGHHDLGGDFFNIRNLHQNQAHDYDDNYRQGGDQSQYKLEGDADRDVGGSMPATSRRTNNAYMSYDGKQRRDKASSQLSVGPKDSVATLALVDEMVDDHLYNLDGQPHEEYAAQEYLVENKTGRRRPLQG